MTQRTTSVKTLSAYFNKSGGIPTPAEYRARTDTPIRFAQIKSIFGSWNRMENILRTYDGRNENSVAVTDIEEVMAARQAAEVAVQEEVQSNRDALIARAAEEAAAVEKASTAALAMEPTPNLAPNGDGPAPGGSTIKVVEAPTKTAPAAKK